MDGILLINKPSGFTSFDVIAKLRGILRMKRLGHSGTLDPMATGVLPVFAGKATKCCDILPSDEKSYTASFVLGITTDTQDTTGKIISQTKTSVSEQEILEALCEFSGEVHQLPPMYSAVSVGGRRLYDLARQGIEVEREHRKIRIDCISLLDFDEGTQSGSLFIQCSKGTYIRTIIHDLGEKLGCGGAMSGLVRNSSSGYKLSDCLTLDEVQSLSDRGEIEKYFLPVDTAFEAYKEIRLDSKQTFLYRNGVTLDINRMDFEKGDNLYRVYSDENKFLGVGKADNQNFDFFPFKNFF